MLTLHITALIRFHPETPLLKNLGVDPQKYVLAVLQYACA